MYFEADLEGYDPADDLADMLAAGTDCKVCSEAAGVVAVRGWVDVEATDFEIVVVCEPCAEYAA